MRTTTSWGVVMAIAVLALGWGAWAGTDPVPPRPVDQTIAVGADWYQRLPLDPRARHRCVPGTHSGGDARTRRSRRRFGDRRLRLAPADPDRRDDRDLRFRLRRKHAQLGRAHVQTADRRRRARRAAVLRRPVRAQPAGEHLRRLRHSAPVRFFRRILRCLARRRLGELGRVYLLLRGRRARHLPLHTAPARHMGRLGHRRLFRAACALCLPGARRHRAPNEQLPASRRRAAEAAHPGARPRQRHRRCPGGGGRRIAPDAPSQRPCVGLRPDSAHRRRRQHARAHERPDAAHGGGARDRPLRARSRNRCRHHRHDRCRRRIRASRPRHALARVAIRAALEPAGAWATSPRCRSSGVCTCCGDFSRCRSTTRSRGSTSTKPTCTGSTRRANRTAWPNS